MITPGARLWRCAVLLAVLSAVPCTAVNPSNHLLESKNDPRQHVIMVASQAVNSSTPTPPGNWAAVSKLTASALFEATKISVTDVTDFKVNHTIKIGPGSDVAESKKIIDIESLSSSQLNLLTAAPSQPGTLTLDKPLEYPHDPEEFVVMEVSLTKHCPNGCSGHGQCDETTFKCKCEEYYTGSDCSIAPPGCPMNCSSHGTCLGKAKCKCDPEWSGAACDNAICPKNCTGHGECRNGTCVCDEGWSKADCSLQGDGCPNNCSNHGRCVDGYCSCRKGFKGKDCSDDMNNPCPGNCSAHGICKKGKCECFLGFSKDDCSGFCPRNCSFRGRCTVQGRCSCYTGFGGDDCSTRCPNRCSAHGECVGGECECFEGWIGADCSTVKGSNIGIEWEEALNIWTPINVGVLFTMVFVLLAFLIAYVNNLRAGKVHTDAIPLFNYFMKKWRRAPDYHVHQVRVKPPQADPETSTLRKQASRSSLISSKEDTTLGESLKEAFTPSPDTWKPFFQKPE